MPDAVAEAAGLHLGGPALQALCPEPVALPLVSIILPNRDRGADLAEAIASIRAQTYPRVEAIIVDSASSDDCRTVIARDTHGDPLFRTLHLDADRGPLGRALAGLDEAAGHLVIFLEPDQSLLPDFVSWHVQAHLAVRRNVAFTASLAVAFDGSGATDAAGSTAPDLDRGPEALPLRRAERVPRLATLTEAAYAQLAQITVARPPTMPSRPHAPESPNMYRRFVLDLLRPSAEAATLPHLMADGHFGRLAHLFGGSAFIFRPLAIRRIHDRDRRSTAPRDIGTHRVEALRVLLRDVPESVARIGTGRFWSVFREQLTGDDATAGRGARDPAIQAMVAEHLPQIVRQFGARPAIRMLRGLFGTRRLRKIVAAAHGGSPPLRMRRLLLMEELRRLSRRVLRRRRATKPGVPPQEAKTRPAAPG